MSKRRLLSAILFAAPAALLGSAGCNDIPELAANQCGNHVIERGEDCDGVGIGDNVCSPTCRLSCTDDHTCPAGWGCGVDRICRQPTGELQDFGSVVALPEDALVLADFDGDGRQDVFARQDASFAVAYVDPAGIGASVTTLAFDATDEFPDVPAVADIDGDGRTDVLLRLEDGLSMMRGQPDRHLLPTPFLRSPPADANPSDLILSIDIDPRPEAPGDEVVAVRDDGVYLLQDPAVAGLPKRMFALTPGKKHLVTPALLYPNVVGVTLQLLVADEGGTTATVLEPITLKFDSMTGTSTYVENFEEAQVASTVISLPPGVTVAGAAQVAHFSPNYSESNPDLLLSGSDGEVYVAFRTLNTRTFGSSVGGTDNVARKLLRMVDGVPQTGVPLITGLVTQDGTSDFVDTNGIHVNVCTFTECGVKFPVAPTDPVTLNLTTWAVPDGADEWVGARVSAPSVNGVDFANIVTWTSKSGFTYHRRTNSYFAAFKFSTRGPIDHVDFGDVNGDGVLDLIYTEPSPRVEDKSAGVRSLTIAFGDALGLPTAGIDFGDVGDVDYLFHARIPDFSGLPDAIDDVYVRQKSSGEYFVFRGSTDRAIQSPLELPLVCSGAQLPVGIARVPALGHFRSADKVDAAVLFQTEDDTGFHWSLWGYDPSTNETEQACSSLLGPTDLMAPGSDDLRVLPADLDGDGTDELLILPVGASQLLVADLVGTTWNVSPIALDGPYVGIDRLDPASDVDDVVLRSETGIAVLWNNGTLSPSSPTPVTLSGTPCPERSDDAVFGVPLGITALQLGTGDERTLVAVSEDDTLVLSVKGQDVTVEECATAELGGGGTAVTAGDVTGDGVDDLVVSRAGGTRIFAGIPVVP